MVLIVLVVERFSVDGVAVSRRCASGAFKKVLAKWPVIALLPEGSFVVITSVPVTFSPR